MDDSSIIGSLIIMLPGLAMIVPVVVSAIYRRHFRKRDDVIETKAYVVKNDWKSGTTNYYPVIEFETEDGKKHQYTSKIGTSPPRVREGTYVTIYYLRDQPHRYQMKTKFTVIFGSSIVIFGMIIILMGFIALIGGADLLVKILNSVFSHLE